MMIKNSYEDNSNNNTFDYIRSSHKISQIKEQVFTKLNNSVAI